MMLPSKCYFISNTCPFFLEGGCDRPHCHYRHNRGNGSSDAKDDFPLASEAPSADENQKKVDDDPKAICVPTANVPSSKVDPRPPSAEPKGGLELTTTDAEAPGQKSPSASKVKPNVDGQVPSYKPTPISVLKQCHIPVLAPPDKPVTLLRRTKSAASHSKKESRYAPYHPRVLSDKTDADSPASSDTVNPESESKNTKSAEYTPTGGVSSAAQYTPSQIAELAKTEYTPPGEVSSSVVYCPSQIAPQGKESDKLNSSLEEASSTNSAELKADEPPPECKSNGATNSSSSSSRKKSHESKSKRSSSSHSSSKKSERKDGHRTDKKHSSGGSHHSSRNSSHDSHSKSKHKSSGDGKSRSSSHGSSRHGSSSKSSSHRRDDDDKPPSDKPVKSRGVKRTISGSEKSISNGHDSPMNEPIEVIDLNDDSSSASIEQADYPPSVLQPSSSSGKPEPNDKASNHVFFERWKRAKEAVHKSSIQGKVRVSSVANVSALINAKKSLLSSCTNKKPASQEEGAPVPSVKRVAHKPKDKDAAVPMPKYMPDSKIPYASRVKGIRQFFEEYTKYFDVEEARVKSLEQEANIAARLNSRMKYGSLIAIHILKLRKGNGFLPGENEREEDKLVSSSIPPYTYGRTLYECFQEFLATSEELSAYGFPQEVSSDPGCAFIAENARTHYCPPSTDPHFRMCNNCLKPFTVDLYGVPTTSNDCHYHFGRFVLNRRLANEERFTCCHGDIHSEPCTHAFFHVANMLNEDKLEGFIKAQPFHGDPVNAGIYAIDCEMCMTTLGSELARVTVTDLNNEVVYDKIVKPMNPILDYCTRFSGITPEMIQLGATVRMDDVHGWIRENIFEETILVGHGLENDLKALKLIHRNVVDTTILFPHKKGLPYKRSLKYLCKEILDEAIQDGDSGHDSKEDACAAMSLILHKIEQEAKKRKPRVIISLDKKNATN